MEIIETGDMGTAGFIKQHPLLLHIFEHLHNKHYKMPPLLQVHKILTRHKQSLDF